MSIIVMGFGILFSIVGGVLLISSVLETIEIRNSSEIGAKIVDHEERRVRYGNKRPQTTYAPVYEYSFMGEIRRHTSTVGTGTPPVIGEEVTLYLSKSGQIYEKRSAAASLIGGIVFMMFGVIFIVMAFHYVQSGTV
ncbi:MAG: hypothetical protein K2N38_01000 [Oscillospiraceae bacterium]|nr:hypothetical protein [Oscillospiraceae bacterium]